MNGPQPETVQDLLGEESLLSHNSGNSDSEGHSSTHPPSAQPDTAQQPAPQQPPPKKRANKTPKAVAPPKPIQPKAPQQRGSRIALLQRALELKKKEAQDYNAIATAQQEQLRLEEARCLKAEADSYRLRAQVDQLIAGKLSAEAHVRKQAAKESEEKRVRLVADFNQRKEAWEQAAYYRGLAEGLRHQQQPPIYPHQFPPPAAPLSGAARRVNHKRQRKQ